MPSRTNPGPLDEEANIPDYTEDDEIGRSSGLDNRAEVVNHGQGDRDVFLDVEEAQEAVQEALADRMMGEGRSGGYRREDAGMLGGESVEDVMNAAAEQRRADAAEEAARIEQEKLEQMEAAHANGDPYLWETTTTDDGVEVEVWILDDGSVVHFDPVTEEVVAFQWPDGEGPVYQGDMAYNGEAYAVYELPDGTQVLVDGDGNTVANLDDIDPDTFYDLAWETEVYYVPQGPPSYDTLVYDADTDELLVKVNTGSETLGILEGYTGTDAGEIFYAYHPPGADYYLVLDADGNVIDQQEIPPQEVWSVLGVVTYYDDGGVVVDVGVAELEVDVIGPEGGISFSVGDMDDLFEDAEWLGSVGAGMEWDEDGVAIYAEADVSELGYVGAGMEVGKDGFEQWVSAEVEIPTDVFDIGMSVDSAWGITENGQVFVGADVEMDFTVPGGPDIGLGVNGYVEVGPDGFELTGGWDGKVGMFGAFLEGGQQGSVVVDEDGALVTYSEYRGVGIEGIGSVRAGYETQFYTDGTSEGTGVRGGLYGSVNDADGDEVAMEGVYNEVNEDGFSGAEWRQEHLDTGVTKERYDKDHDDVEDTSGIPTGPDGAGLFDRPDDAEESELETRIDPAPLDDLGPRARARAERSDAAGDDDIPPMLRQVMERRVINTEHTPLGYDKSEWTVRDRGGDGDRDVGVDRDGDRYVSGDVLGQLPIGETEKNLDPSSVTEAARPPIWTDRDGPATPPTENPPTEPAPEPEPPTEPLPFPPDDTDDDPTEPTEPKDPDDLPPIFTERVFDNDEDGDGIPDGRPDRGGPILGDDDGLDDITGTPPMRHASGAQTADATIEHAAGTIERPSEEPVEADVTATLVDDITATPQPGAADDGVEAVVDFDEPLEVGVAVEATAEIDEPAQMGAGVEAIVEFDEPAEVEVAPQSDLVADAIAPIESAEPAFDPPATELDDDMVQADDDQ